MKIFRSGKTSRSWNPTDTKPIAVEDWQPNKILEVDGTIYKEGKRHTAFGVKIEPADIVALSSALVKHHQVMREGLEQIRELIALHRSKPTGATELIQAIDAIARKYLNAS
jgi:hypothetical protein